MPFNHLISSYRICGGKKYLYRHSRYKQVFRHTMYSFSLSFCAFHVPAFIKACLLASFCLLQEQRAFLSYGGGWLYKYRVLSVFSCSCFLLKFYIKQSRSQFNLLVLAPYVTCAPFFACMRVTFTLYKLVCHVMLRMEASVTKGSKQHDWQSTGL